MAPVRLAVFDCDGTLVDSQHSIIESVRRAWTAEGLEPPDDEFIRTGVGLRLDFAIPRLAPDAPRALQDRLIERYKQAFFTLRQQPDHEEPLYPGTIEALNALDEQGILLAIATGKSRRGLNATLDRHGLAGRFVVLKTADDGPSKPDPTILRDAVKEAGAEFETTVMIGDTVFDIAMARAARTNAVGVSWGYHPIEELNKAGADAVIDRYAELPGLLHRIWSF